MTTTMTQSRWSRRCRVQETSGKKRGTKTREEKSQRRHLFELVDSCQRARSVQSTWMVNCVGSGWTWTARLGPAGASWGQLGPGRWQGGSGLVRPVWGRVGLRGTDGSCQASPVAFRKRSRWRRDAARTCVCMYMYVCTDHFLVCSR